jgi:hypothetical protein
MLRSRKADALSYPLLEGFPIRADPDQRVL